MESVETSAIAALAAIREGDVSAEELTSLFLSRIESSNTVLGALRHVSAISAIKAARDIDTRIQSGAALPPLAGLPVVIKENCDTAGLPCSGGLLFRSGNTPRADSAVAGRLRAAGAIVLGVSVSDPGAFGVRTAEVTHPHDPGLTVGGSSGGSAAALAAGLCLGAIGTDTGGSIRIPSACCGTVGLKPTFGAVSMDGVFPLVPSLDHVGPMARSVADVRLLWDVIAGKTQAPVERPRRVGYDRAWVEIADEPIREAFAHGIAKLERQGIDVVEIKLPDSNDVLTMHGHIFIVEAAAWHCAHYPNAIDSYPPIAREWFAMARGMKVDAYVNACSQRVVMTRAVDVALESVDAIITPTLCVARPSKSVETLTIAGREYEYVMALVRLTCLFDHTGHPAATVPALGGLEALTSSIQIIASHGNEKIALDIASLLREID